MHLIADISTKDIESLLKSFHQIRGKHSMKLLWKSTKSVEFFKMSGIFCDSQSHLRRLDVLPEILADHSTKKYGNECVVKIGGILIVSKFKEIDISTLNQWNSTKFLEFKCTQCFLEISLSRIINFSSSS